MFFNRFQDAYRNHSHMHNYDVDINVNRAPTDESVRLLNEFQEKAKDNIVKVIDIRDNECPFNAIAFVFNKFSPCHNHTFGVHFSLNGEKYTVNGSISDFDLMAFDKYEVIRIVSEKISQQITLTLMDKVVKNLI